MNNNKQVFLHIIVWTAILLVFLFASSNNGTIKYESVIVFVYFGLVNIVIFYINYLLILPKFLNSQKYVGLTFAIVALVLISGVVKYALAYCFEDVLLYRGPRHEYVTFARYYLEAIFVSTFFVFLSTAYKFSTDWFINEKLRKNLENEKLGAELAFLKSQVNPHFLLNSLNNIYSLAYQKSDKTPEAVLKLSEIMRYMLYESNDMKVDLSKEIRYLENYIELQKLRFKNSASVQLEIIDDGSHHEIVPLILIAFVENAFKHGVANDSENPIQIKIELHDRKLHFKVKNKKSFQNKDETGGIGLQNVQRRLELLYPDKYRLNIDEGPLFYSCELSLDL